VLSSFLIAAIGVAALVAGISGAWSPCGFAMIETFTPQMCGGMRQRTIGVALFATGAIGASALLGAVLGWVGHGLPTTWTMTLLGVLALVGAARDFGLLRIPLPQRRGQVPESWRRHLPVMIWAPAYGVMLGLGVLTFQVVSTFWVVAGASIALGTPSTAAACFALFGLGRVLMVIVPPSFASSYSVAAVGIGPAMPAVRRVNGLLLVGVGLLALASSPAVGAAASGPIGTYLPSISGPTLGVVTGAGDGTQSVSIGNHTIIGATSPSVAGQLAAVVCTAGNAPCTAKGGVAVVNWSQWQLITPPCPPGTGTTPCPAPYYPNPDHPVIPGAIRPSLSPSGTQLAYIVANANGQTLYLQTLASGSTRAIAHVSAHDDISGPSLSNSYLAWAINRGLPGSSVVVMKLATRTRHTITTAVANTDIISPSIFGSSIGWIVQDGTTSYRSRLMIAAITGAHRHLIATLISHTNILWGLSLGSHIAYSTIWNAFHTGPAGAPQPAGQVVHYRY
jgi:hypothetical protein